MHLSNAAARAKTRAEKRFFLRLAERFGDVEIDLKHFKGIKTYEKLR